MSASSLPEWKQQFLERRRREEKERERREQEEGEKLASMPAWKRGIIERRRAKQEGLGQQEKELEAGTEILQATSLGLGCASSEMRDLNLQAGSETQSLVSAESIGPIRKNPFMRTQGGWRKVGQRESGGRSGNVQTDQAVDVRKGDNRNEKVEMNENWTKRSNQQGGPTVKQESKAVADPYFAKPLAPCLTTIKADNIIIIEKNSCTEREKRRDIGKKGIGKEVQDDQDRMGIEDILAGRGSITEIRASEVLIIKPSGTFDAEYGRVSESCKGKEAENFHKSDPGRSGQKTKAANSNSEIGISNKKQQVTSGSPADNSRNVCKEKAEEALVRGGHVSQLLSRFGEHHKPPLRSKSSEDFVAPSEKVKMHIWKASTMRDGREHSIEKQAEEESGSVPKGVPKRSFSFSDRVVCAMPYGDDDGCSTKHIVVESKTPGGRPPQKGNYGHAKDSDEDDGISQNISYEGARNCKRREVFRESVVDANTSRRTTAAPTPEWQKRLMTKVDCSTGNSEDQEVLLFAHKGSFKHTGSGRTTAKEPQKETPVTTVKEKEEIFQNKDALQNKRHQSTSTDGLEEIFNLRPSLTEDNFQRNTMKGTEHQSHHSTESMQCTSSQSEFPNRVKDECCLYRRGASRNAPTDTDVKCQGKVAACKPSFGKTNKSTFEHGKTREDVSPPRGHFYGRRVNNEGKPFMCEGGCGQDGRKTAGMGNKWKPRTEQEQPVSREEDEIALTRSKWLVDEDNNWGKRQPDPRSKAGTEGRAREMVEKKEADEVRDRSGIWAASETSCRMQEGPPSLTSRPLDVRQEANMFETCPQLPVSLSHSTLLLGAEAEVSRCLAATVSTGCIDSPLARQTGRQKQHHVEVLGSTDERGIAVKEEDNLLVEGYDPQNLSPSSSSDASLSSSSSLPPSLVDMSRIYNLKPVVARSTVSISERNPDLQPHSLKIQQQEQELELYRLKLQQERQLNKERGPRPQNISQVEAKPAQLSTAEKTDVRKQEPAVVNTVQQQICKLKLREEPQVIDKSPQEPCIQVGSIRERYISTEPKEPKQPSKPQRTQQEQETHHDQKPSVQHPLNQKLKVQLNQPQTSRSFTINPKSALTHSSPPQEPESGGSPSQPHSPSSLAAAPLFSLRSSSAAQNKRGNTITITPRRSPTGTGPGLDSTFAKAGPQSPTTTSNGMEASGKRRYPAVEEIEVIGGYQILTKSCMAKNRGASKGGKVSFDDVRLEQVCEYPSEDSMLASLSYSLPEPESESTDRVRGEEEEDEDDEEKALFLASSARLLGAGRGRVLRVDESCRR